MKKCILSIVFCLVFTITFAQTPKELIGKMKQSLIKLKTLDCEINEHSLYYPDKKFIYKKNVIIVFDTICLKKPLIKKARLSSLLYKTDTLKSAKHILSGNKSIEINDFTKEINLENVDSNNINDIISDINSNIFPYFNSLSLNYLDSLLNPDYQSDDMDMKKVKYEVLNDTACLSGDCYLVKISAPSLMGTEIKSENKDSNIIINFKMENHFFWINKHSYLPERYRKEWTLEDNKFALINDYRFTKIKSDIKINNAVFIFKKAEYKDYRIGEVTAKGFRIIQEAFRKAPDIRGLNQYGDSIGLYEEKARLYIIDFWFANCPPCMAAKQFIEKEIIPEYQNKGLYVLGVNPVDDSFESINKALGAEVPHYPFILNKQAAHLYHLSSYPGIYILNSKFEVIKSFSSIKDNAKNEIKKLLEIYLK
ncbi:MAG: redoxin family protein [Bacteroidetes bacterium]|nr:redoxin family protein [Bacteroidota bacterium]